MSAEAHLGDIRRLAIVNLDLTRTFQRCDYVRALVHSRNNQVEICNYCWVSEKTIRLADHFDFQLAPPSRLRQV